MPFHGFEGNSARAAELREALDAVLAASPERLVPGDAPGWLAPEELARSAPFDELVAAYRKDRLAMPVAQLFGRGIPYYNFEFMAPERLAWFVPALLAAWLAAMVSTDAILRVLASTDIACSGALWDVSRTWSFPAPLVDALDAFARAALRASLATDGPSRAFDTVRLADALYGGRLGDTWAAEDTERALVHFLAAADAHEIHPLLDGPPMRAWLERAFFAWPARADAITSADEALRG